jgi:orotidine-5'-phosphate decarboxylase
VRTFRRTSDRLIVALDDTSPAPALRLARLLRGLVGTLKVGSALFTAAGPEVIRRLRGLGFRVMLDLKFHDIPSTVELSCRASAARRVSFLTVHASGGRAILEAAVRGARLGARGSSRPLVLAVTVLTSAGMRDAARVPALAAEALRAGCDGLVASAREAARLRRRFGATPWIVCPGIRPSGAGGDDQRRIGTPAQALAAGADALVVGRPITASAHPRAAAEAILREMEGACGC